MKFFKKSVAPAGYKNKRTVSRRRYHSVLRDALRSYCDRLCTATLCDMSASY